MKGRAGDWRFTAPLLVGHAADDFRQRRRTPVRGATAPRGSLAQRSAECLVQARPVRAHLHEPLFIEAPSGGFRERSGSRPRRAWRGWGWWRRVPPLLILLLFLAILGMGHAQQSF